MDITSYLLGKNSSGGGGTPTLQDKSITITENGTTNVVADSGYDGLNQVEIITNVSGGTTLTNMTDVNNMLASFDNYLDTLVDNYTAYTNEPITIYTPDADSTNFMIQKRSNGKYRIVWCNDIYYLCLISNSTQGFCYRYSGGVGKNPISAPITLTTEGSGVKGYYSGDFSTLESLLLAIQNSNGSGISYTSYSSGLIYSGVLDANWTSPISNLPVFQSDLINPFTNGKVLSHNTTILPISNS